MRRLPMLLGPAFAAAIMIFPACRSKGPDVQITTEEGVTVVHNPKEPVAVDGKVVKLRLEPELTIGKDAGDGKDVFGGIQLLVIDKLERIYVLDWKDFEVKVFDAQGRYLRSFGRKGQGPREMNQPFRLIDLPEGGVAVLDGGSKLIFFSPEGEFLGEVHLGAFPGMRRYVIGPAGCIYANIRSYDETTIWEKLIKFSPEMEPLATFASSERKLERRVFNPFSPEFLIKLTDDGNILWANPSSYELVIMDRNGKLLHKIVKDCDPVRISEADRESYIRATFGDRPVPPEVKIDIPEFYPAVQYVAAGGDGRFFVRTYDNREGEGGQMDRYDVFDAEGRYIAKFYHTRTETVMSVINNHLYSRVEESAGGSEKVRKYRLIWN
jgi:hypothetical protein